MNKGSKPQTTVNLKNDVKEYDCLFALRRNLRVDCRDNA